MHTDDETVLAIEIVKRGISKGRGRSTRALYDCSPVCRFLFYAPNKPRDILRITISRCERSQRPCKWRTILVHAGDWTQFVALGNNRWIVVGNHGNDKILHSATAAGISCKQEYRGFSEIIPRRRTGKGCRSIPRIIKGQPTRQTRRVN